ncbi:SAM-dependent methyltransferase [Candidatus Venteria ishoeyi]|uniref:HEPN domain protein n=1 Tax=Candidatus Venteria ishoeyi TaxID=1899563 RepID=A0A1H6FGP3_9GAMM|nr:SAM-dependent methyltransferase [Candidatus Venteria ishoeyi]SEH09240.1 Uncharacterised protein [Candidatus Venteria ishoeyi]
MDIDFKDAARRHKDCAELLYQEQCWGDADHLYGFSAECTLKSLMITLGASTNANGELGRQYWVHINKLWDEYNSFLSGRGQSRYVLSPQNPFANWDISQRYANSEDFDRAFVDPHRRAMQHLFRLLQQAGV